MRPVIISAAALLLLSACANTGKQPASDSLTVSTAPASTDSLRQQIATIAAEAGGTVGVAIRHLGTGDTLTLNDTARLPMQSAFKFPIAMAVLKQVDEGKLKLDQQLPISTDDYFETYSPLKDSFPKGVKDKTIANLIYLMVSKSDNVACDVLIRTIGGTKVVDDFIHGLGVENIAIKLTEEEMNGPGTGFEPQFQNWANVSAYTHLLDILDKGTALSKGSNDFLVNTMLATTTGRNRLPGLLPPGTPLAHKTGSGYTHNGLNSATNDAGTIYLPNGQRVALAVFVSMSP
ncbi:class A beta-lactamase, partial [Chitinophaga sp.]|uniref:class A beta-lactamase n=1 Tax=Chitinophaga sp. TaxID=1869181 RepID=UPI002624C57F